MTTKQRIALMAQWWPEACRAQGWRVNDRALRLRVLSDAVGRPITSANQLNTKADVDSVIAHLGMLKDNVALTIETDHPEIGAARPLRFVIGEWQLKCLAVYMGHDGAQKYLAEIIRDKFRHASRVMPLTIEQLDAAPVIRRNKAGELYESPSQLDQVLMKLASAIQSRRKAAGDSTHDMKLKAGVECDCATY